MKRIGIALATSLFALLMMRGVRAAPVAPELEISITPTSGTVVPGQLVLVHVSGGFPLQIGGTLDGQPLNFFWNGDGYVALVAFSLDAQPGTHSLRVAASQPGSGRGTGFETVLTVQADPYPFEEVTILGSLTTLLDPLINQVEIERLSQIIAPVTRRLALTWPFEFPASTRVTSLYGSHRIYNDGQLRSRHTGIDFRLGKDAPIFAAADGRVVSAEPFDVRGNVVIVDHGWGIYTQYAHMSALDVVAGDEVRQGDIVGRAGRTGRSSGVHLHWEVIVDGAIVDPLFWMALSPNYVRPAFDERITRPSS